MILNLALLKQKTKLHQQHFSFENHLNFSNLPILVGQLKKFVFMCDNKTYVVLAED